MTTFHTLAAAGSATTNPNPNTIGQTVWLHWKAYLQMLHSNLTTLSVVGTQP